MHCWSHPACTAMFGGRGDWCCLRHQFARVGDARCSHEGVVVFPGDAYGLRAVCFYVIEREQPIAGI